MPTSQISSSDWRSKHDKLIKKRYVSPSMRAPWAIRAMARHRAYQRWADLLNSRIAGHVRPVLGEEL